MQVESLNSSESEGQKEDTTNVEQHHEAETSVTQDVKDRTDLETLPDSDNEGSNNRDAIAK